MSTATIIRHTCTETGKALPFGKLAPEGQCVRCDELRGGAPARQWRGRRSADPLYSTVVDRVAEYQAHLVSVAHKSCTVCTFGDW